MCEHCSFFTKTQEPYSFLLERREWQAKRQIILARDNNCCQRCGAKADSNVHLHVHHKHYISGLDPWEYKDSELITLCDSCHNYVHSTTRVPVYRLEGDKLVEVTLTPCRRCGGAGRFPEYKHVQNGICFRCHGARYEELISFVENYAQEHNININDLNDGFLPLDPKRESRTIAKVKVCQSQRSNHNYVTVLFEDGALCYCCLDYSVQADAGDELDINTLKYKHAVKQNGEKYVILKGTIL